MSQNLQAPMTPGAPSPSQAPPANPYVTPVPDIESHHETLAALESLAARVMAVQHFLFQTLFSYVGDQEWEGADLEMSARNVLPNMDSAFPEQGSGVQRILNIEGIL